MDRRDAAVSVLLADEHPILREGLRAALEKESAFHVVGEAADGDELLGLLRETNPKVLLIDLMLAKPRGMEMLRKLSTLASDLHVIVMAAEDDENDIAAMFRHGVRGVVLRESTTKELIQSIYRVMNGQSGQTNNPGGEAKGRAPARNNKPANGFGLTGRELQIVSAVVSGFSNKEIAAKFGISENTVKHHVTNIFDKIGVYNRLELALFAIHHGLVKKS